MGSGGDDETGGTSGGGVRTASCTDAAGDGGPADLTAVELTEGGEGLRAEFTLAAPLDTATGTPPRMRWPWALPPSSGARHRGIG